MPFLSVKFVQVIQKTTILLPVLTRSFIHTNWLLLYSDAENLNFVYWFNFKLPGNFFNGNLENSNMNGLPNNYHVYRSAYFQRDSNIRDVKKKIHFKRVTWKITGFLLEIIVLVIIWNSDTLDEYINLYALSIQMQSFSSCVAIRNCNICYV